MPKVEAEHLTQQQRKWFASIRDGLERDTGRSLTDWVEVARTCPETKPRARLAWFKATHGLMQNRASYVLNEAFPPQTGWSEPDALRDALWIDLNSRSIFLAVEAAVLALPDVVAGQRKGYSAWSRSFQFAALRPVKGGGVRLGLALSPDADARLEAAAKNENWSERLKAAVGLKAPEDVDGELITLIAMAQARS